MCPILPPIALARPPPSAPVVSQGSHALTRTTSRAQHDEPSGAQASHAIEGIG